MMGKFRQPGDEPSTSISVGEFLRILKPYFAPKSLDDKIRALGCFGSLGVGKACSIIAPIFLGQATNDLANGEFPVTLILIFCLLSFGSKAFTEIQRIIYLKVKEVATVEIAERSFGHLQRLSLSWHLNKRSGVVLRSMDRGVQSANTVVDMLFLRLIPTFAELAALVIIFITALDALVPGLILLGGFLLYILVTFYMSNWRRRIRSRMNRVDNEANQKAVEALTNFETVKCFANEDFELRRYKKAMQQYMRASKETQFSLGFLNLSQELIMKATQLGVLIFAAKRVADGDSSLGDFVAINTYLIQVFAPLSFLGTIYSVMVNAHSDMTNLSDIMREKPDIVDKKNASILKVDHVTGATIEFKDVWFHYPNQTYNLIEQRAQARLGEDKKVNNSSGHANSNPSDSHKVDKTKSPKEVAKALLPSEQNSPVKDTSATEDVRITVQENECTANSDTETEPRYVLRGISFKIPAGTTTAIVGSTGAGKSTISRLLFRFYDIQKGGVYINGNDIADVTQKSLRTSIGIVPQDTTLFNDTIGYNIQYGKPGASEEEIIAAAKDAAIAEFVESVPEKYETKVGERGLKLSGGEKQRVAIARTLLKDPPILVLDEATSALDSRTEASIQEAISRVRKGRTVLIIAHRLSTIKDADNIIVLEKGEIVESGSHNQLLEKVDGKYAKLWNQQVHGNISQEPDEVVADPIQANLPEEQPNQHKH